MERRRQLLYDPFDEWTLIPGSGASAPIGIRVGRHQMQGRTVHLRCQFPAKLRLVCLPELPVWGDWSACIVLASSTHLGQPIHGRGFDAHQTNPPCRQFVVPGSTKRNRNRAQAPTLTESQPFEIQGPSGPAPQSLSPGISGRHLR
jgi:hypothetical protein